MFTIPRLGRDIRQAERPCFRSLHQHHQHPLNFGSHQTQNPSRHLHSSHLHNKHQDDRLDCQRVPWRQAWRQTPRNDRPQLWIYPSVFTQRIEDQHSSIITKRLGSKHSRTISTSFPFGINLTSRAQAICIPIIFQKPVLRRLRCLLDVLRSIRCEDHWSQERFPLFGAEEQHVYDMPLLDVRSGQETGRRTKKVGSVHMSCSMMGV